MLDLLIAGGLIVDGTGSPGFYGAVGIDGDTTRIIRGDTSLVETARAIDATGKVVCPGFVDLHAHSGLVILAEPRHEPKVRQGVTTELIGVDGNSYAPFPSHEDLLRFVEVNSGLDGSPTLPGQWSTVAEYLSMFDGRVAVNIAYVIGNSPLRISAVGWDDRPVSGPEMENMKAILREGMEEGAYGISTGLDYPPGSYADTAELVELSREAQLLGGIYHTHVRYGLGDRLLDLVEEARGEGLDVTFDCYPYIYSSTRLLINFPQWAHDGGPERLKEVLRSPEGRERLRRDVAPRGISWDQMWLTYFKRPHNRQYEGRSIAEVAQAMGKGELDAMCDLLLEEDLQTSYVAARADGDTLPEYVAHPLSMVGTDGLLIGNYPSPRTYGSFPLILSQIVREGRFMSLADAIRKMTSFPAQRLGIPDRGILRDGMRADIVVFDSRTIGTPATREDPRQFPTGVEYVVVNGQVVIDQGRHTGALPGRALRRGRGST